MTDDWRDAADEWKFIRRRQSWPLDGNARSACWPVFIFCVAWPTDYRLTVPSSFSFSFTFLASHIKTKRTGQEWKKKEEELGSCPTNGQWIRPATVLFLLFLCSLCGWSSLTMLDRPAHTRTYAPIHPAATGIREWRNLTAGGGSVFMCALRCPQRMKETSTPTSLFTQFLWHVGVTRRFLFHSLCTSSLIFFLLFVWTRPW